MASEAVWLLWPIRAGFGQIVAFFSPSLDIGVDQDIKSLEISFLNVIKYIKEQSVLNSI